MGEEAPRTLTDTRFYGLYSWLRRVFEHGGFYFSSAEIET